MAHAGGGRTGTTGHIWPVLPAYPKRPNSSSREEKARAVPPAEVPPEVPLMRPTILDTLPSFGAFSGTMAGTSARGTAQPKQAQIWTVPLHLNVPDFIPCNT
jgi:hypothetical protein